MAARPYPVPSDWQKHLNKHPLPKGIRREDATAIVSNLLYARSIANRDPEGKAVAFPVSAEVMKGMVTRYSRVVDYLINTGYVVKVTNGWNPAEGDRKEGTTKFGECARYRFTTKFDTWMRSQPLVRAILDRRERVWARYRRAKQIDANLLPQDQQQVTDMGRVSLDLNRIPMELLAAAIEFNNGDHWVRSYRQDHGRFYTDLSSLPRSLRPYLLIDGERTMEIDVSSSHYQLLARLSDDPSAAVQELRTLRQGLMEFLERDEATIKQWLLAGLTPGRGRGLLCRVIEKAGFPAVAHALRQFHRRLKKLPKNAASRFLMMVEGHTYLLPVDAVQRAGMPIFSIHDGFVIKQRDYHRVMRIFTETLTTLTGIAFDIRTKDAMRAELNTLRGHATSPDDVRCRERGISIYVGSAMRAKWSQFRQWLLEDDTDLPFGPHLPRLAPN